MAGKPSAMPATLPFPVLEISDMGVRHNARDNGQNRIRQEGISSIKEEFSEYSKCYMLYLFQVVNAMAVGKNYLAGNLAERIRFLQSRTDMASLRGRSLYHKCRSGSTFGPRLTFTRKNMIKTDVSEKILICHIYRWTQPCSLTLGAW